MTRWLAAAAIAAICLSLAGCGAKVPETNRNLPDVETKTIGVANVAVQGYAMGGSAERGTNIFANDGDPETYYCSESSKYADYGEYLFVDLTEPYVIRNIVLREAENAPQPFLSDTVISVSDDGKTWNEIKTVNGVKNGEAIDIGGVKARFVKVAPADKSQNFSLAEIEINADVDNKHNLILNYDDMRLYDHTAPTLAKKTVRIGESGNLSFYTSDPAIATIDGNGKVSVTGYGKCSLYAYDGENLSECKVETVDNKTEKFMASLFYHSTFCHPGEMIRMFDLAAESGGDYIEETRTYDAVGNIITDYCLFLCAERDILYQVCDKINGQALLEASDEELRTLLGKYEFKKGFGGIYTIDEPFFPGLETMYADLVCRIAEINPDITAGFNILPAAANLILLGKNLQYCNGNRQYVSTDYYPFSKSGFQQDMLTFFFETLQHASLKYDVRTAFYLQAQETDEPNLNFRKVEDYEFRFEMFLAMSYGLKNYKWFLFYTPTGLECYSIAMMDKDYNPTPIYGKVKDCNEMIHKYSPFLADTRSIETYITPKHTGYKIIIPESFPIKQVGEDLTIYISHYIGKSGEYYSILRDCQVEGKRECSFEISNGAEAVWLYNDETDVWEKTAVTDGKITIETDRGSFRLLSFSEKNSAGPNMTK